MAAGHEMVKTAHIDTLTGVRMVLMMVVLIHHIHMYMFTVLFPHPSWLAEPFINSWLVVDMFFMLSGFVIALNYADKFEVFSGATWKKYLISRVARIFPAHLFTTAFLFVTLLTLFGPGLWLDGPAHWSRHGQLHVLDLGLGELLKSLFLVQGWSLPTRTSWNTVSWSVSAEWFVYLFFPFLLAIARRFSSKQTHLFVLFSLLFVSGLSLSLASFWMQGFSHVGIIRVITEFLMGVVAFFFYRRCGAYAGLPYRAAYVWAGIVLAFLSLVFKASFLWLIPVFAWFMFAVATGRIRASLLAGRIAVYGGSISYSFYLCHGVVLILWLLLLPASDFVMAGLWAKLLYVTGYVLATLALSLFVFHVIEEPARQWIVRRFNKPGV